MDPNIRFKKHIYLLLLIKLISLSCGHQATAQRVIDKDKYPPAYFDSIRHIVYDTAFEHYTINAYRLSSDEEITVDGRLVEAAWKLAQHRGGFLEKEPFPLVPESEKTEFAILYDDENLYVGVWCWDSEPEKIIRELSPRGTTAPDHVQLFFDSFHDHRTGYKMTISPTGVQVDELRYDDIKRDHNWNGVWYSEGSIDDKGWYAEVKIPFLNFRYADVPDQTWGFNIIRNISKNASRTQWKPHLPEWDVTTRMSQLGHVEHIDNITSGRTFEFRPYGTAGSSRSVSNGTANSLDFGGDLRYSPTPNLTADLTINPDFAQVDADVYEINLTRFPTRFKELRPFFTERINIFNTPLELFYSRRIGAKGDIAGGLKATGKLKHGFEFGALGNQTGSGVFSSSDHGEKATYGVFRVKKDIGRSGSLGFLGAVKEQSEKYNRIFGLDGIFLMNDKNIIEFQVASGDTEQNAGQQKAAQLTYTHTADLWGTTFTLDRTEPGFEINRIGYIQKEPGRGWNRGTAIFRVNPRINKYYIRRILSNLTYEINEDLFTENYINRWLGQHPGLTPNHMFGQVLIDHQAERIIGDGVRSASNFTTGADAKVVLLNEMSLTAGYKYFSVTELTGNFAGDELRLEYGTRPLNKGTRYAGIFAVAGGTYYNFKTQYPGTQNSFNVTGQGRLFWNVLTELQSGYTKTYDPDGEKDGKYFNMSLNTTWMFTKDFFFRMHVQGIMGTTYANHTEIQNDYLLSGLISWEYRPGSFMYLAYNEGRFDAGNPVIANRLAFRNRTLLFKISYFFSI